jgi:hypothetical protein
MQKLMTKPEHKLQIVEDNSLSLSDYAGNTTRSRRRVDQVTI